MPNETTPGAPAAGDEELLPEAEDAVEVEEDETEGPDDEESEEDGGDPEGEPEVEGEKKPSRSQQQKRALRARIASLEEIANRESAAAATARAQLKALSDEVGEEPKESDFTDERKYTAALAAWEADRRMVARQKKTAEAAATNTQETSAKSQHDLFRERVRSAADRYPDIEAKVFDETNPVSPTMANIIRKSDRAIDLAYHLATHREEAKRIAAMTDAADAAYELGRIEARLSAPKPRTQTKAPAPVPTVSGGGARAAKSPDRMSPKEYEKWRANGGGA